MNYDILLDYEARGVPVDDAMQQSQVNFAIGQYFLCTLWSKEDAISGVPIVSAWKAYLLFGKDAINSCVELGNYQYRSYATEKAPEKNTVTFKLSMCQSRDAHSGHVWHNNQYYCTGRAFDLT